jgi:ATP-dependent exoDNAse (exonuclease V) beta subunit
MLAPIAGRGEPAKELNQWMKRLRDAREAAERKRLFYVACTRAREELHLFAAAERSAAGEILRARNSLLKAAWPAAEMHFADGSLSRDNAKVLSMSSPAAEVEDESFAIAASGNAVTGATEPSAMLRRLPLSFDPSTRFRDARTISTGGKERTPARAHFERPEGSFAARSFGNAVHAFLELVSKQLEAGFAADTLLAEVAGWQPRIEAVLRSNGLSPSTVRLEAQRVLAALQNSLRDDVGRWLLGAQTNAASEHAVTTWDERRSSFRLDRVFMAGTEPLAAGNHCLWIVDYKTTAHGRGSGVEAFLEAERLKYGAQMKSYAQAMAAASPAKELRVALYYPLLPKLVWWKPESV